MPTKATDEKKKVSVQTCKSPEYRAFYSNYAQVGFTAFDIGVTFSEVIEASGESILAEQRGRVSMAPLQAKALLRLLTKIIGQYEEKYGAIPVPPSVMDEQ